MNDNQKKTIELYLLKLEELKNSRFYSEMSTKQTGFLYMFENNNLEAIAAVPDQEYIKSFILTFRQFYFERKDLSLKKVIKGFLKDNKYETAKIGLKVISDYETWLEKNSFVGCVELKEGLKKSGYTSEEIFQMAQNKTAVLTHKKIIDYFLNGDYSHINKRDKFEKLTENDLRSFVFQYAFVNCIRNAFKYFQALGSELKILLKAFEIQFDNIVKPVDSKNIATLNELRAILSVPEKSLDELNKDKWESWLIYAQEKSVGFINVVPAGQEEKEIGFALIAEARGQGVLSNVLPIFVKEYNQRLYSETDMKNKAAVYVLEKSGFIPCVPTHETHITPHGETVKTAAFRYYPR